MSASKLIAGLRCPAIRRPPRCIAGITDRFPERCAKTVLPADGGTKADTVAADARPDL